MLPIPFSLIWVFQILIGYSEILRIAYLRILFFSIGYFCKVKVFQDFTGFLRHIHSRMQATFSFDFKDVYLVEN